MGSPIRPTPPMRTKARLAPVDTTALKQRMGQTLADHDRDMADAHAHLGAISDPTFNLAMGHVDADNARFQAEGDTLAMARRGQVPAVHPLVMQAVVQALTQGRR